MANRWKHLGDLIKLERTHKKWFQYQLVQATGLSKETISALENGHQTRPDDETLWRVDDALGWESGSCRRVVAGGKPIRLFEPELAEITYGWHRLSPDDKDRLLIEFRRLTRV